MKPEVALSQVEGSKESPDSVPRTAAEDETRGDDESENQDPRERAGHKKPKRYHGTVTLDPIRAGRDASQVADEVITHLVGLVSADVRVSLEIEADIHEGVPDNVVRIVTENGRALKFDSHGFEEE